MDESPAVEGRAVGHLEMDKHGAVVRELALGCYPINKGKVHMFSSLKSGLFAVVLSAVALVVITQQTHGITVDGSSSKLSTMPDRLDAMERDVRERSIDELRIEEDQVEGFAPGICSVTCAPCFSNSGCPPVRGQTQTCWFGVECP